MPDVQRGCQRRWSSEKRLDDRPVPADKTDMPRLRLDTSIAPRQRVALLARLTELVVKLQGARREELDCAIEIGQLLVALPSLEDRVSVLKEAGFKGKSKRTAQVYVRLAEHREVIAQHAAPSIRAAEKLLRTLLDTANERRIETYKLKLDNVASPEALAHALASVKGESVSIRVQVTRVVKPQSRRQPPLPFPSIEDE